MKKDKSILKMALGISVALLLCVCPVLRAQDVNDTRTREEVVLSCEKTVREIETVMRRWTSEGVNPREFHDRMHAEFFPAMKAGKYREAEEVAKWVLASMKKGPPVPKPKDLSRYLRKTSETQYLILPVGQAGSLYGGRTEALDQAIKKHAVFFGKPADPKKRNWGFHFIIFAWRFDPEHTENPHADIARAVEGAFDVALRNDIAVHLTVEDHEWSNRPDLWNFADENKPGYDPGNRAHVEWSDWDGTPHPHRYRNWGKAESMPPVMCYNSPAVLKEVSRLVGEVVAPPIVAGLERLKKEGKEHLFSGLTVGAEPALPNYENVDRQRPQIAKLMDRDGAAKSRLGYNALSNNGYSKANPPKDWAAALAQINQDYTAYWCRKLAQAGIPTEKMYTHVAAGAGVVGSPSVDFTNAPIRIAFNDHSRPGWTTYPVGPLRNDFEHLYQTLAQHGNPHWASTEAGPNMGLPGGKKGLSMKAYLSRHFDYGATLIVFNTGATSKELSDSLNEAIWGRGVVDAYKAFLNPVR